MDKEIKARGLGVLMLVSAVPFAQLFILDPLKYAHYHPSMITHYNMKGIMVPPLLLTSGLAYLIWGSKVTEFSNNRKNWGWKEYLILLIGFLPVVATWIWFEKQVHG